MGSTSVDPALHAIWAEVLEVDALDGDDDFFALGGNSLLATQITARVAAVLGVEVPLEALFEAPTLREYAALVATAEPAAAAPAAPAESGRGGLRWLRGRRSASRAGADVPEGALSELQSSAWSVQRYVPGLRPHVGEVFTLQGPLDVPALERALTALVERHEILRSVFPLEGPRPRAVVLPAEPVRLAAAGGSGRRAREEDVRRQVDAAWEESFEPAAEPPLRLRLIRSGPQTHVFVFILHELLGDGQSFDLLVRELGLLYGAFAAGRPSPLPEPVTQYREVVRRHGPQLADEGRRADPEHWRAALTDAPLSLPLPFDDGTPPSEEQVYTRRTAQLPGPLVARLRTLAQEEAATSFMLYLAALFGLLHRMTGEDDLLVRSAAANRGRVEWEQVVGFFSMVLPLRVRLDDDPTFRTLLQRTRECSLDAFRHAAYVPEDNALRAVDGVRGLRGWSVLFRLWDPTTEQPLQLGSVRAKPYRSEGEAGRLVVMVTERSDGRTVVQLSSTAAELDARFLGELLRAYERLLEQAAEDPERRVGSELELLTGAERDQLARRAGAGAAARGAVGDEADALDRLVTAQAAATPDAIAYDEGGGAVLTYAQLETRAEGLARLLHRRGFAAGALVGVRLPPSADLLVGLLGVWKAGAACVPLLGPGASDAGPPAPPVVVDAEVLAEAERAGADGAPGDERDAAPRPPDRLALVLATAGVAGPPTTVRLTHRALCHAAMRQRDAQRLGPTDRVAHVPGRGVWSWALAPWAALAAGAAVVSPARAPARGSTTPPLGWLEANGVTVAAMDAGLASTALARPAALTATLRLLLVQGAGAVTVSDGARIGVAVERQYGLLEASGTVLSQRLSGSSPAGAPVVGEPAGASAYVVDRHGNPLPPGVAGELWLGGPGIAGTAADVTEQPVAIVAQAPFATGPLLRTGDLARRRADGPLEVFGRLADEVRHRGIRLTPALHALEQALARHPGVIAAAACWDAASATLVGCVVPRREEAPPAAELDGWLQRSVEDWVLPGCYAAIEALPLRADGLPDRLALLADPAVRNALARGGEDDRPRTRTERKLAELWQQVLGRRQADGRSNFFADGGNLIRGIELAQRAGAAGIGFEPRELMDHPTLRELAATIDARG